MTKDRSKKKDRLVNLALFGILLLGAAIMAYPSFADYWNSFHQTQAISTYVEQVNALEDTRTQEILKEAEDYNASLLTMTNRFVKSDERTEAYESVLDITGTGIMGYIEIPKIKVSLPIYHGTEENVLQTAVGHLQGSSLPVGGIGTHCVVSGHRGLPSARLFTDLDKLQAGDHVIFQVLNRTLTYEVDQIRIVLPHELEDLEIDPEQDYVTLVTCTPYSINTHRLLVRGHRIENDKPAVDVKADALQLRPAIVAPAIAVPMLTVLLIWLLIVTRKKKGLQK